MQLVTTTPVRRRPAPPAASTMPPPPPSPSNRAAPPLRPPELPLPSALVPPKKRRVLHTPPKATAPFPPPPPVPAIAGGLAVPALTPLPENPSAESPLFWAQEPSPPPPSEKPSSPPPPPPPAGKPPSPPPPPPPEENPSSLPPQTPPPPAEKPSSPPPPPPLAENPSSPPPPPPPTENPFFPPPPPPGPSAADEKPSAPPPTDAAAEPAPAAKPQKVTRKVRTIRRRVPKCTIAAGKAAAEAASAAAGTDKSLRNAAANEVVEKKQSFGGNTIGKPAASSKPVAVCESQLGKGTAVCDTQLGMRTVGGGTLASVPAMDIGGEHEVEKKLGSRGEDRAEVEMSEWQRRRMTEVFVGGLNTDAKEEDVRAALSAAGEITEVRMIMDPRTKKNKGYCFVRYRESSQARKAIAQFRNVKICGKKCAVAALDGNDKIFLGNIDKKWKKEDLVKLLQKIGIENIDVVTLLADSNNPSYNRGFAFLELETYRDAQIAYRKLSRKDVFGKGVNIRVDWAEPLNGPDENQMQKVKAVFVDGVPNSWDQAKLTEIFKKYGKVELVALSRDMRRAKRNDFALVHYTTHEAAILCLESFDEEQLTENGSKVDIRVSLAKSVQMGKNNMEDHKFCISQKDKTRTAKSERKLGPASLHILSSSSRAVSVSGYKKSSPTHGFVQVLRELAPWRQHEHTGSGSLTQNYPRVLSGEKRPFSALDIDSYCMSRNPHGGHERNTYATSSSSYSVPAPAITQYSHHESRRCLLDTDSVPSEPWGGIQMRQACSSKSGISHDSWH